MAEDLEKEEKEIAVAERKAESLLAWWKRMLKELEKIEEKTAYTSGELFGAAVPSDIKKIFDKPEEKTFCQLLDEAIKDEESAKEFYRKLPMTRVVGLEAVKAFEGIASDEGKHLEILKKIKKNCD